MTSPRSRRPPAGAALEPRLRVLRGRRPAFGPGKAELLRAIAASGSIRSAAAGLGMSYNRAWTLVREANASFREPLVAAARGGGHGGGAVLTSAGRTVLERYERMENACRDATRQDWLALKRLLR